VLWSGDKLLEGAPEALEMLRKKGMHNGTMICLDMKVNDLPQLSPQFLRIVCRTGRLLNYDAYAMQYRKTNRLRDEQLHQVPC
jgi:hypothetical protein